MSTNKYKEALVDLSKIISGNTNSAEVYYLSGYIKNLQNDYVGAEIDLNKSIFSTDERAPSTQPCFCATTSPTTHILSFGC